MSARIKKPEPREPRDLPSLSGEQRSGVEAAIAYLEQEYPDRFPEVAIVMDRERLLVSAGVQAAIQKLRRMVGRG